MHYAKKQDNSPAPAINEQLMEFQFNSNPPNMVRIEMIEGQPWFVAKDVCEILGIKNSRDALTKLDEDEKGVAQTDTLGGKQKMQVINESGLYALVIRSDKPEAKKFRKWITAEVLPALRQNGAYKIKSAAANDFIDLRDVPYDWVEMAGRGIRRIAHENEDWYSINDLQTAIGAATSAGQVAKKLNAKRTFAVKIWLFGNTHESWFTTKEGAALIISGSRTLKNKATTLVLPTQKQEGGVQ